MFNILEKKFRECDGKKIHITAEPSFIKTVKWEDFIYDYNSYIEKAVENKDASNLYDIHINLD